MKKISYYIFAALMCATSLSSCSDMLAEESAVEVDKSKYMNNASEAETVLLGVYRNMVTDALYSYNLSILFNITNDIASMLKVTRQMHSVKSRPMPSPQVIPVFSLPGLHCTTPSTMPMTLLKHWRVKWVTIQKATRSWQTSIWQKQELCVVYITSN